MRILLILSVLLVASVSESIDSTSSTTPSSVFHIINLTSSNRSAEDTTAEDLRTFELLKYFVYPARHGHDSNQNATVANGIQSVELIPENHRYDLEPMGLVDRQQRHYPSAADPYHLYANHAATGYGMSQNLMDPLFLMATLAFVMFLINSILGLVGRLNLPAIVRARNRWHTEMVMAERRDAVDAEHLDEIEMALQIAFDEFEKYLDRRA